VYRWRILPGRGACVRVYIRHPSLGECVCGASHMEGCVYVRVRVRACVRNGDGRAGGRGARADPAAIGADYPSTPATHPWVTPRLQGRFRGRAECLRGDSALGCIDTFSPGLSLGYRGRFRGRAECLRGVAMQGEAKAKAASQLRAADEHVRSLRTGKSQSKVGRTACCILGGGWHRRC
jgi:hypothetical protein